MLPFDLKDTYIHIVIHPDHWNFLKFIVNGIHCQFTALPFHPSAAPCIFTKYMAPVAVYLWRFGIHMFSYLNDWLVRDWSESQILSSMTIIHSNFSDLGLLLSLAKSILKPGQRIEFIGAFLHATEACAFLPQ